MDEDRFDRLTRAMAAPATRRTAVRGLAFGGLLGALGAARATTARAPSPTCTLAFTATVRLGPSAGQILPGGTQPGVLQGQVSFGLTASGAIDGGSLRLSDGTQLPVVGQATGRALDLRITIGATQTLVAVGVGEQVISVCQGAVDGLATGPRVGDLGDWHATAHSGPSGSSPAAAATRLAGDVAPVPVSAGTEPTVTRPTTPATAPTSAPTVGPTGDCAAGQTKCGNYCVDLTTDATNCGVCSHACKPLYEQCTSGACTTIDCGAGHTNCAGYCADLTSDANHCGTCGTVCPTGQGCAAGICKVVLAKPQVPRNPSVRTCNGTLCGSACVNTATDTANCGACGVACGQYQACTNGVCTDTGGCGTGCADGLTACGCGNCVDTSSNAANCGACGHSCPLGAVCSGGACVTPACLPAGADCNVDTDCCGGSCIVGVQGVHDYCGS